MATAAKNGKTDRSKDRHAKKLLPIRATKRLRAALQSRADRERRTLSQMGEMLLEESLGIAPHKKELER